MLLSFGLLMILTGLAIMGFGLFLFYAWLPVLYALVGFDIGLLVSQNLIGDAGATAMVFGAAGAVIFGAASYLLEPYRRILLGISLGILFGFSVAVAFGLDGMFGGLLGRILALACGVIGGLLLPRSFDLFVVGASAISGAAMVVTGANHILGGGPGVFDRPTVSALSVLITVLLAAAGVGWQYSNIAKWRHAMPMGGAEGK